MVYGFMVNGGAHEEETQTVCTEDGQAPHRQREGRDQTRSGRARQARKSAPEIAAARRAGRSETGHPPAAIGVARARLRIEQLEAAADQDFLLDIPNRR